MEIKFEVLFSVGTLTLFFFVLTSIVLRRFKKLFLPRFGRRHSAAGAAYLTWIALGIFDLGQRTAHNELTACRRTQYFLYDMFLGLLGIVVTLSAAFDFKHDKVVNPKGVVSGTLADSATVSFSEMIEHSFYQGLNLSQAIYLHLLASGSADSLLARAAALYFTTSTWLLRGWF